MDNKKIGTFISDVRKEKGLSQKQLAEKIFVTDKAISKWETGKGIPDVSNLIPLAETLDVSVMEILSGKRTENNVKEENQVFVSVIEQTEKKRKKLVIGLITISVILSILLNVTLIELEHYNYNSKYWIDDDYQHIYYDVPFLAKETYSKFEIDDPGNYGSGQYGVGIYMGNVAGKNDSLFLKILRDDKMYIVYSENGKVIIRLENDFEEDYFYTNDESLIDKKNWYC